VLSFVYCSVFHNDVQTRKSIGLATTAGMDIVLDFHLNVFRSHTRALSVYLCVQIISTPAKWNDSLHNLFQFSSDLCLLCVDCIVISAR
jgi:hypothetical protein